MCLPERKRDNGGREWERGAEDDDRSGKKEVTEEDRGWKEILS